VRQSENPDLAIFFRLKGRARVTNLRSMRVVAPCLPSSPDNQSEFSWLSILSDIVDGCVYLGSSLQSVEIGYLAAKNWLWWPVFLIPFALVGSILTFRFWHDLPTATQRYNAENGR